jgi:hypothetical protein
MAVAIGSTASLPSFNPLTTVASAASAVIQKISSIAKHIFAFCTIWLTFKSFETQVVQALHDENTPKFNILVSILNVWNPRMAEAAKELIKKQEGGDVLTEEDNDTNKILEMALFDVYHPPAGAETTDDEDSDIEETDEDPMSGFSILRLP